MSYANIDDKLPHHRKVREIAPKLVLAAWGLHVAAICFAQNYRTDGRIRLEDFALVMPTCPRPPKQLMNELVRVHLWDVHPDGGWVIHDYLEWNASARDRQSKARGAAQARWGTTARSNAPGSATGNAQSNASSNAPRNALLSSPLHSTPLLSTEMLGASPPDGFSAMVESENQASREAFQRLIAGVSERVGFKLGPDP